MTSLLDEAKVFADRLVDDHRLVYCASYEEGVDRPDIDALAVDIKEWFLRTLAKRVQ